MTASTSAVAVCCSSASLCLGDQPGVLHGDYGLVGEGSTSAICRCVKGSTR